MEGVEQRYAGQARGSRGDRQGQGQGWPGPPACCSLAAALLPSLALPPTPASVVSPALNVLCRHGGKLLRQLVLLLLPENFCLHRCHRACRLPGRPPRLDRSPRSSWQPTAASRAKSWRSALDRCWQRVLCCLCWLEGCCHGSRRSWIVEWPVWEPAQMSLLRLQRWQCCQTLLAACSAHSALLTQRAQCFAL